MYRVIDQTSESTNIVSVIGKLQDLDVKEGVSKKTNKPYRRGTATVHVEQTYGNPAKSEVEEIRVNFLAMKFKNNGDINPAYDSIGDLMTLKTVKDYGFEQADRVRMGGGRSKYGGKIVENMFVSKNDPDKVVSTWQIDGNFMNVEKSATSKDCATFNCEIYIASINDEEDYNGNLTGRLKIRAGILRYGKKLDCVDFYAENPTVVEHIRECWTPQSTLNVVGYIRQTSEEVEETNVSDNISSSWAEIMPVSSTTTKKKHELIISSGSDFPYDEESSFNPEDMAALCVDRNTRQEQTKIDYQNYTRTKTASTSKPVYGNDWE